MPAICWFRVTSAIMGCVGNSSRCGFGAWVLLVLVPITPSLLSSFKVFLLPNYRTFISNTILLKLFFKNTIMVIPSQLQIHNLFKFIPINLGSDQRPLVSFELQSDLKSQLFILWFQGILLSGHERSTCFVFRDGSRFS